MKFSPITLIYRRPILLYLCKAGSFFFYDFVVVHVLRICFLLSINDVGPDPVNCPGELSCRFFCFLFISYTTKELHPLSIHCVVTKAIILTIKFFSIKVEIVLVLQ